MPTGRIIVMVSDTECEVPGFYFIVVNLSYCFT